MFSCFLSKHLTDSVFKLQFRWEKNGKGREETDGAIRFPFSSSSKFPPHSKAMGMAACRVSLSASLSSSRPL